MTDNFENIRTLLDFGDEQNFYFIQILQRRKENPDMKTGARVIDNFYLYNKNDLDKLRDNIIMSCTKYNARAYINVNKLNLERIALLTMKKVSSLIVEGQYKAIKNAYPVVCGKYTSETNKRWVVDIDEEELKYTDTIKKVINKLHKEVNKKDYKIIAEIPSKSGIHIISNPFNLKKFNELMDPIKIDVHKNAPTILYTL